MEQHTQPSFYQQHKFTIIKSVLSVILISLLVLIGLNVKNFYNEFLENQVKYTDTYRDLLPQDGKDDLTSSYTFFINSPSPLASFTDGAKTYKIYVYKLNLKSTKPLDQLVKQLAKEPSDEDHSGNISSTTTKGYKISNQRVPPTNIQDLRIYLSGDSIKQLVKNDSLLSYGLQLKKLKIYDEHSKLLALLDTDNGFDTPKYAEVLFVKRKDGVFVLYKLMRVPKQYEYNNEMYKLFTTTK